MPSASIQIELKPADDSGDPETGELTVSVSGLSTSSTPDGTEYGDGPNSSTPPTVRVESDDGTYQEEKDVGTFLRATFPAVPVTALTVTATHPDFEPGTGTVDAGDFS